MNDKMIPDDADLMDFLAFTLEGDSNWGIRDQEKTTCSHKWKPTLLVFSTVYDCEICGKKKEEV